VNSTKEKSSKKENTYDDNDDMYFLIATASLKVSRSMVTFLAMKKVTCLVSKSSEKE